MENKKFLDNNIGKIVEMTNAILEKYPADRSEEVESILTALDNALDAYIVEYGETLTGEEFETCRLFDYENEETPIVISSIAYYMQYNLETKQEEQESSNILWFYDKEGEPEDTYSMSQNYFPLNDNVKQYIETGHINFDPKLIEQILEKYALLLKENELSKLEDEEKAIIEEEKENEGQGRE